MKKSVNIHTVRLSQKCCDILTSSGEGFNQMVSYCDDIIGREKKIELKILIENPQEDRERMSITVPKNRTKIM